VAFSSVCTVVVGNAVVDVVVVVVGMFTITEYFCEICAPWPLSPPLDTNNINIALLVTYTVFNNRFVMIYFKA
jgi:hypothetical protein